MDISRRRFLSIAGLALLGCISAQGAAGAGEASNVERCGSIAATMSLGAPLPRTREKLRRGQAITIVALGSSSTTGFGTLKPSFPEVLKAELSRRHPSLRVNMIVSGRLFDTIAGNLRRLDKDVLRYRPDLVIWQLGTNDVLWHPVDAGAKDRMRRGVARIKQANADVILLDLQYAPAVRARPAHAAMQEMIAAVAREETVGLFPRYAIMQRAAEEGVRGLVGIDGLHNSGAGYRCIGLALARTIDPPEAAAKSPSAAQSR